MVSEPILGQARDAFERQEWSQAHAGLSSRNEARALDLDDIERLAIAAHLIGREAESRDVLAQGYRDSLRDGDRPRAARFAFWLGHGLMFTGEISQASGWFARARTLLDEYGEDSVERGYLLIPEGIGQVDAGDPVAACATFTEAQRIGARFGDVNLVAMAGHGRGRALIRAGLIDQGMRVLDEVIVAVTSGEVSPMVVGDVYCGVLEACREVFDLRRASEWTTALGRWCETQPDLIPYRGPCLVHRAEVLQLHGQWESALEEARRACEWLSMESSPEGPGDAFYLVAELHRLRGQFAAAEEGYRQASRLGRSPEPGLPLLWLAHDRPDAATAAIQRALGECQDEPAKRAMLLEASVQISLAGHDTEAARGAATQLGEIATELGAPFLSAVADRAAGSVLLAEGDAGLALVPLRRAWTEYRALEAPYEAARTRVLVGRAYQDLGDAESAAMEFDAARWVFEELGATPELARLGPLTERGHVGDALPAGLTAREVDVLRLLAAGRTNKEIGTMLVISEHTVARHVQNMLGKLSCSSRAALAAFAVAHGLVSRTDSQF